LDKFNPHYFLIRNRIWDRFGFKFCRFRLFSAKRETNGFLKPLHETVHEYMKLVTGSRCINYASQ